MPPSNLPPPPPPLLLSKRVTAFLRANLTPQIHCAVLTTPAGHLLVHASSLPAHTLRRQCAVAASLWATNPNPSHAVTVQLENGAVFVIRQLACGMLFICMGGDEHSPKSGGSGSVASGQQQQDGGDGGGVGDDGEEATTTPLAGENSEEVGSCASGMSAGSVLAMRRQVEELGRALDARLGALSVPEMGIGVGA
ncbi:hypothetical protein OQA88_9600 [Cercophora sp. LCS_1]